MRACSFHLRPQFIDLRLLIFSMDTCTEYASSGLRLRRTSGDQGVEAPYLLRSRARSTRRIVNAKGVNGECTSQLLKIVNTDSPIHCPFSPVDLPRSNLPLGVYRCEEVKSTHVLTGSRSIHFADKWGLRGPWTSLEKLHDGSKG
jgi:hypothetical protein